MVHVAIVVCIMQLQLLLMLTGRVVIITVIVLVVPYALVVSNLKPQAVRIIIGVEDGPIQKWRHSHHIVFYGYEDLMVDPLEIIRRAGCLEAECDTV